MSNLNVKLLKNVESKTKIYLIVCTLNLADTAKVSYDHTFYSYFSSFTVLILPSEF